MTPNNQSEDDNVEGNNIEPLLSYTRRTNNSSHCSAIRASPALRGEGEGLNMNWLIRHGVRAVPITKRGAQVQYSVGRKFGGEFMRQFSQSVS